MKRCLNCRKTYEDTLSECPYCGYVPRSKATTTKTTKKLDRPDKQDTQVPDTPVSRKGKKQNNSRNIYAASGHSGSFYLKSGERLNNKRYSIINVIGFGVFGVAYECFDNYYKKHVILKEYMPSYLVTRSANGRDVEPISEDAEVKFSIGCDSFTDENIKLSENNVECVPLLIECFRANNTAYAVTELVTGESLSSLLSRKGQLNYESTAGIITGVLQGLRRLNRISTIHGDICPENIIIGAEGKVYLLDYNLSDFNKKMYTQRESGTPRPGYSAPELYYKDMDAGPWTDVYAASAVMYKMLTGVVVPNAVKRGANDTVTPVSKLGVAISSSAEKAMIKALCLDPKKRIQSPEDFLNGFVGDGFDNITAVKEKKKAEVTVPSRGGRSRRRDSGKFLKGLLGFLILAIIAVLVWLFVSGVFRLPGFISDALGMGTTGSTAGDIRRESEPESSETESSDTEDTSSKGRGLLDNILSNVASSITDEVSSLIEEHLPSDVSIPEADTSSFYEDASSFIDEWYPAEEEYSDNDYYENDENGGEDNYEDTYSEQTYDYEEESETPAQDDYNYEDLQSYANDLIGRFLP